MTKKQRNVIYTFRKSSVKLSGGLIHINQVCVRGEGLETGGLSKHGGIISILHTKLDCNVEKAQVHKVGGHAANELLPKIKYKS